MMEHLGWQSRAPNGHRSSSIIRGEEATSNLMGRWADTRTFGDGEDGAEDSGVRDGDQQQHAGLPTADQPQHASLR